MPLENLSLFKFCALIQTLSGKFTTESNDFFEKREIFLVNLERTIPEVVGSLRYLSVFYINDNSISSIAGPFMKKCTALSSLWIERNNITTLPFNLHILQNLNYLHCGKGFLSFKFRLKRHSKSKIKLC